MSTIELETRIAKMQEWEAIAEEAKQEADAIRDTSPITSRKRNHRASPPRVFTRPAMPFVSCSSSL